jgi:hypothetical protein
VVASHNVVDIVDSSRSKSDFSEISWPYTSVGILGLILREVGSIDMIMNVSRITLTITCLFRPIPDSSAVCSGGEQGGL